VRAASLGLFDHLALRTALIDEALHAAVDRGISQVVILGAGLDARAHRLRWLERCTVFEVDHPSTQGLKRRKAATMPVRARELRYAPCDFQDVSLDEALLGQGLDPERPSVFIWEGVTMYLPASAVDQSLARISRLSASGSTLVATYLTPQVTAYGRVFTQAGLATLSLAFEPVRSTYTEAEMRARLLQQGFRAQHDVLPLTQAASRGIGGAAPLWGVPDEHVVVALKA
jgi:methyltransferase (TIGR00027 family)